MVNEVGIFFSMVFFLVGFSHMICPKEWEAFFRDLAEKTYAGLIIAMYSLPVGLVILSFHNSWVLEFPVFVTICGWILTLKSILYMLFPELPRKKILRRKHLRRDLQAVGGFMMLFGALSVFSYYW